MIGCCKSRDNTCTILLLLVASASSTGQEASDAEGDRSGQCPEGGSGSLARKVDFGNVIEAPKVPFF